MGKTRNFRNKIFQLWKDFIYLKYKDKNPFSSSLTSFPSQLVHMTDEFVFFPFYGFFYVLNKYLLFPILFLSFPFPPLSFYSLLN